MSLLACSSGFVYTNLNWIIHWYIDDYVELNEEQTAQFQTIVDEALVWHKQQELPRYNQHLQMLYDKLDRPLNEDDISRLQTLTRSSFQAIQQRVVPSLLPLYKTFDPEQQKEFWANVNRKQLKYNRKFLSRTNQEYTEDLSKRYYKFTKRLLGTLSQEQKSIINSNVSSLARTDAIWLKARQAWLDNAKLQYEIQGSDWLERMQAAWLDRDQHYSIEDKLKIDKQNQQAQQLLLTIINSRSEKQTQHFKKFIKRWKNKFTRWQQ